MMWSFVNVHLWVNELGFDYSRLSCRVSLCNYLGSSREGWKVKWHLWFSSVVDL
jgi:hypothetical protein